MGVATPCLNPPFYLSKKRYIEIKRKGEAVVQEDIQHHIRLGHEWLDMTQLIVGS